MFWLDSMLKPFGEYKRFRKTYCPDFQGRTLKVTHKDAPTIKLQI